MYDVLESTDACNYNSSSIKELLYPQGNRGELTKPTCACAIQKAANITSDDRSKLCSSHLRSPLSHSTWYHMPGVQ